MFTNVWLHSHGSELNKKFDCQNHV